MGLLYELVDLWICIYEPAGLYMDLYYGLYGFARLFCGLVDLHTELQGCCRPTYSVWTIGAVYGSILQNGLWTMDFADLCCCTYGLSGLKFKKTAHLK